MLLDLAAGNMLTLATAAAIIQFVALRVTAQSVAPVWGQCGGNGWSGPTVCESASVGLLGFFVVDGMCVILPPVVFFIQAPPVLRARLATVSILRVLRGQQHTPPYTY